jgi:hypothetical protein
VPCQLRGVIPVKQSSTPATAAVQCDDHL